MNDSSNSGLSRRSILKGAGAGASAGLAGCINSFTGGGGDGTPLFWEYGFPNEEGAEPIWRNAFTDKFEEQTGEEIEIGRFSYEDMRQKYLTGAQSGDPDALEGVLSHLNEYVKAGSLEPLDDRVEDLDYFDGFVDSALEAMRYEGDLYGLPYNGNGRALIYRKDVFEDLGQDPPETAAEFHEVGRMINEEYDDMWAYHNCTKEGSVRAFQEWMSHVYQHTDQLFVKDGDDWSLEVSADALGQVFDNWYYQVWASDDPLGNPDHVGTGWQVNDPGYLNGQFAMIECGTWLRGWTSGDNIDDEEYTSELLDERTAVDHLPHAEEASKGTFLEVKPVMLNAHADQKDLGWEAVKAWAHPDVLNAMAEDTPGNAATPVHEDVESTLESEDWTPFTDVFETGRALAKIGWGPVRQEFYDYMQQVTYGETDPYDAGEQLHEALQNLDL